MLNEQQLKTRLEGIGGSEAPIVAGLSARKQPLTLYYEKRGELTPEPVEGEPIDFGHYLEEVIAKEASRRLGVKVRRVHQTLRHKERPFILGHIDRDFVGQPWILECKNVGFKSAEWGPNDSDEVPAEHFIQSQHYLAITGKTLCKLAALFSGNHMRIYEIPRDPDLIEDLIDIETKFWENVKNGIPPIIDYEHPTTVELLKRLYPGTTGEIIELPESATYWHHVEREAAELEKAYRSTKETAQCHIKRLMGEASVALLPDGTGYTRKEVKKKGFTVEPASYIDFRFSKKPKGAKQ